jgi:hypothetical protein
MREIVYLKNGSEKACGVVYTIIGLVCLSVTAFLYTEEEPFSIVSIIYFCVGSVLFFPGFARLFETRITIINSAEGYVEHRSGCFPLRRKRRWDLSDFSKIQISDNYKRPAEETVYYGVCLVGEEMVKKAVLLTIIYFILHNSLISINRKL